MKIQKINDFFKALAQKQIKYRFVLLIGTLAVIALSVAGLSRSSTVNDREQWFNEKEAIEIATKKFEAQFGNNDDISILVQAKDVFDPKVLEMIRNLGQELLDNVPYAKEVRSLADLEVSIGDKEGIRIINPFKDGVPKDKATIEKFRKIILSKRSIAGKTVSKDCTQTWLTLSLREYPPSEQWSKKTNKDPMFQTGEAAIKIITNPKYKSDSFSLKAVGMPYTETEERDFFGKEAGFRVLSGFVMMIVVLAFLLRSFWGVVVASVSSVLGIMIVFGIMGWLGIGINANMVTLPMLLGMALCVAYSVHLVNAFKRAFRKNGQRKQSVFLAVEETGWPLFFTAITTIGSMISFVGAGIIPVVWTGLSAAGVVLVNYLLIMIFIPILLSFGKDKQSAIKKDNTLLERFMLFCARFILSHKIKLGLSFGLALLLMIPQIFNIKVNIDIFKMMGTKIPYIKRIYEVTQSQLGSYISYNITVDYDKKDAIKDPQIMKKFDKFASIVGDFELTKKNGDARSMYSIIDTIKGMNQLLHEDNPQFYKIPNTKEMIAQTLLLYEISGGEELFKWIDDDYSMFRLQVSLSSYDANEMVREFSQIQKMGQEMFKGAKVNIIGEAVKFAQMNKKIVMGEIKSVVVALVIISLLLILVFGSIKTGLIGMIPNISPMIVLGAYMGYFGYSLDMMTMMIIPMMLGIAVDDTIHFINQIKYQFEKLGNYEEAILSSFKTIGATLAMTTTILVIGFAMYSFSPANMMARIGLLAPLGLLVALLMDYILTPILIYYTKPFGKESQNS